MRIATWNVGRFYTPKGNNRLADKDVPRVARALRTLAPDVVLLQELTSGAQLDDLLALLPGYAGVVANRCDYDRHVAALARLSLRPDFEQHRLEPTGRGLVALTFDFDGARGAAHAVHLDVRGAERKRSQIEGILAIATGRPEPLAVVAGDFNLDPWLAKRLRWTVEAESFEHLCAAFTDTGRGKGATCMKVLRIDHMFMRPRREGRATTHVARGWRLPLGDHEPLVLDVS